MTPEQAVAAALVLGARLATPIHYGMHVPDSYLEYPSAEAVFLGTARERGLPVQLLKPGELASWLATS